MAKEMITYEIAPCTPADADALAYNNISAFYTDSSWKLIWGPDASLSNLIFQSSKRQANNLLTGRDKKRHQKAVDPVTSELVGYARWILPEGWYERDGEPVWKEAMVEDVREEERKRCEALAETSEWKVSSRFDEMDDAFYIVSSKMLAERSYIKLDYLAVHPDQKGKGIASALVASGVELAKKIRLPLYVLSYKAGRGVYSRLGFKEVNRVIQDLATWGGEGEYGAYFMIWEDEEMRKEHEEAMKNEKTDI